MSPEYSAFDSVITQFRPVRINEGKNIKSVVLSGEGDVNVNTEMSEAYVLVTAMCTV